MISFNIRLRLWEITCDRCSTEFLEIDANSFIEAVKELKREGWHVFKNYNDEWTHTCPECGLL